MEGYKEHFLLEELRFLAAAALVHATRIEDQARIWIGADAELRPVLTAPADEQRAHFDEIQGLIRMRSQAQTEVFSSIEAFLSFCARMALIVYPTKERRDPVRRRRAQLIRAALRIAARHGIASRELRNKWFHFDEALDGQMAAAGTLLQPARFTTAADLLSKPDKQTIRLVVVDQLELRYRKVGAFQLRELFDHVRDIDFRADHAIQTWGARWPQE